MSLGEAFVEVHADLRPFGRDLQRNLRPMVERFERELNRGVNAAMISAAAGHGRQVGDRLSRGIRNSLTEQFKKKNAFIAIAAALGAALDDGISALPTEVKAAIVAGIILATPVLSAFLTGALTSAVGFAVAGIGVLLASQFEEVQQEAAETGRNIRVILTSAAYSFGPAIINVLNLLESRLHGMEGLLGDVFDISASFLEPLAQGFLEGLQDLLQSLRDSLGDIRPFVEELGVAIGTVMAAIGQSIEILARSGDDGVSALRDLASIIAILIISASVALLAFTKFYGVIRDLVTFLNNYLGVFSVPLQLLARFFEEVDRRSEHARSFINTNTELEGSFVGVIAATNEETQALKAYSQALERASQGVKNQLELAISWEESLDRITESIKENGKTLDIRTEKGRTNAREFMHALEIAEEQTVTMLRRGQLTSEQAVAQYDAQTAALRQMAIQAGIGEAEFNALFNEIIEVGRIRVSSEEMGIDSLDSGLDRAGNSAARLYDLLQLIKHLSRTISSGAIGGALAGFSEGGIQYTPIRANLAEDGPEAIIPLTKPARAAQILQQSGLSAMLSGSGGTTVLVFIGNEQLDARTVRIVQRNNQDQARALAQGGRTF